MKKLLVTLLFLLTISVSFSQTAQETLDYLKTYYSSIPMTCAGCGNSSEKYHVVINNDTISVASLLLERCYSCTDGICNQTESLYFNLRKITSINYQYQRFRQLSGDSRNGTSLDECWVLTIRYNDNDFTLKIDPNKDKTYLDKYKKALTRLATLAGAKIVNEDLFGN